MSSQTPFATYASNFINQSFLSASQSTDSDSQPLFFSFTEPSTSRRADQDKSDDEYDDEELDDDRDDRGRPYLKGGSAFLQHQEPLTDDPYLRLDDEEVIPPDSHQESIPMLPTVSPALLSSSLPVQPPEPSEASSSLSGSPDSSPLSPPLDILQSPTASAAPPRTTLTQSLLPRDGLIRSIFSLPDPGRVPHHKYNDHMWTVMWCTSLLLCAIGLILSLLLTRLPVDIPSAVPYSTLLHAIPFLTLMTLISTALSYFLLIALQFAVHPVLVLLAVVVPAILLNSSIWAFSGSFIWDGQEGTWGQTVGLRIYSLVPFVLGLLAARSLHNRRHAFLQTARVTELAIRVLRLHSPLLMLSPALLFACMLFSLPFISLLFRLFLVGYLTRDSSGGGAVWHVQAYAGWLISFVLTIWVWSWFVARGTLRTVCASVIGAWYFKRNIYNDPEQTTHAALARASGPSLGTVCYASLVLSIFQSIVFGLRLLRRVTTLSFMPTFLHPLTVPIAIAQTALTSVSSFALVYTGLTGEAFSQSAKRAKALTSIKRPGIPRRQYALLSTLATMLSFASGSCIALATYLFTAYTLHKPYHAPLSAFLSGVISSLVIWFSTCLIIDASDTLYICYCIDKDSGAQHSKEVFIAFEGRGSRGHNTV